MFCPGTFEVPSITSERTLWNCCPCTHNPENPNFLSLALLRVSVPPWWMLLLPISAIPAIFSAPPRCAFAFPIPARELYSVVNLSPSPTPPHSSHLIPVWRRVVPRADTRPVSVRPHPATHDYYHLIHSRCPILAHFLFAAKQEKGHLDKAGLRKHLHFAWSHSLDGRFAYGDCKHRRRDQFKFDAASERLATTLRPSRAVPMAKIIKPA